MKTMPAVTDGSSNHRSLKRYGLHDGFALTFEAF